MEPLRLRFDESIFADIELGRVCPFIESSDVIAHRTIGVEQTLWSVDQIFDDILICLRRRLSEDDLGRSNADYERGQKKQ